MTEPEPDDTVARVRAALRRLSEQEPSSAPSPRAPCSGCSEPSWRAAKEPDGLCWSCFRPEFKEGPLRVTYSLYDYDEVLARFRKDTEHHQMSVLLNKGLYRHLHFCRRGDFHHRGDVTSWQYWYELITTPGQLTIRGDMGTYVFSREVDMFGFFRSSGRINPDYWGEKLIAVSTMSGYREYSRDMARAVIWEDFDGHKDGLVDPDAVWRDIENEVLNDDVLASEDLLRDAMSGYSYPHEQDDPLLFEFVDVWDMDFTDYTFHYLWCCHAIREGILQWDAMSTNEIADANMTGDHS